MTISLWLEAVASAPTTTTPAHANVLRDSFHPLAQMLVGLWPLWALLGVIGGVRVLLYARRVRRLSRAGMFEIDQMSGHEFEQKLALTFRSLGYRAEIVGHSGGDYGGDLVVSKDGRRTVVQAKCWKKNVGVKAIQEAVGAKAIYRADEAMVVTNSRFTKQARHLASENKVTLWGREELVVALLKGRKVNAASAAADPTPDPPPAMPLASGGAQTAAVVERAPPAVASPSGAFCARCGDPVSVKVRDFCLAHPKRFGGLIYCYEHQREVRPG